MSLKELIKFIDMEDFGGWDSGDFGPNLPKGGIWSWIFIIVAILLLIYL